MAGSLTERDATAEAVPYAMRRTVEMWTAVAFGLAGLVVTAESLTHDIGWNETGPATGYFPFGGIMGLV